ANLAQLFLDRAQATPEAVAIVTDAGEISYGALAGRVAAIGNFLRTRGLAAEEPVGVLMRRSPDLVAALLAILHVGGAYVPLDPDDPAERNRRIRHQSGATLVLTDRDLGAAALPDAEADLDFAVVADLVSTAPLAAAAPGGARLAYILFTSGSTGEPKGVEVEHRNAVNLVLAARDFIGFGPNDRYLATSTIGFDISVAELFVPLTAGGSVLLRDRKIWLNPRQLAADVRRHGVTVVQGVPSAWASVLAEVPDFPRVRIAITTGEPVRPALAQRLAPLAAQVWNLYGPTETTVWSTAYQLPADASAAQGSTLSASIGRPIANTTIVLLNEDGTVAADGERGELCLGGLGLARGYCDHPELTREKFITAPGTGERLYRTGDLAAWSCTGDLLYFGRNDDQMKIRGFRIEPREVEAAILTCPEVGQAAATWFATAVESKSIIAALVLKPGVTLTPPQLHAWLRPRLPGPLIPSRWVFLETLPRAPSGKIDRNAIRRHASAASAAPVAEKSRPLSPTETTLAVVWRSILNLPSVGPDDHFFSIGGDSLAAVRMITEVEARFALALPVQAAFEAPILAQLAGRIDQARVRAAGAEESHFIFPLVEIPASRPVFFSNVDLKMAAGGAWTMPCSLYCISHWAHGSGFVEAKSLAELARAHLGGLRTVQPAGPYRIAGYSFGGLVALEMAQQLRRAGQTVELLFLLDPMQPFRTESAPGGTAMTGQITPLDETFAGRLRRHVTNLLRHPRQSAAYIWQRLCWHGRNSPLKQWLIYKLVHLHGRRPNPISQMLVPQNRWPAFWYSARRMAKGYVARRYEGAVTAVFPDHGERYAVWKDLLGAEADVHLVAASHHVLFDAPTREEWQCPLQKRLAEISGPPLKTI
ncbi:MAG: amino acid adenylation domain-containing protein, partial [Opitutaceae bacterium]